MTVKKYSLMGSNTEGPNGTETVEAASLDAARALARQRLDTVGAGLGYYNAFPIEDPKMNDITWPEKATPPANAGPAR